MRVSDETQGRFDERLGRRAEEKEEDEWGSEICCIRVRVSLISIAQRLPPQSGTRSNSCPSEMRDEPLCLFQRFASLLKQAPKKDEVRRVFFPVR